MLDFIIYEMNETYDKQMKKIYIWDTSTIDLKDFVMDRISPMSCV